MQPTLRLFAVFTVSAAALLLSPAWTHAADDDQAARRTQAEALLRAMHTEQVLTRATTQVYQMVDKYKENASTQADLTPDQKIAAQKAQDEAHTIISQQLSWEALKGDFIQTYAEAFTEDDLKGLAEFYNTPLGQKLVEKQPAVTEKMGKLTQQKMMAVMPSILQKIKEGTQKTTSSPATATPAVPAAPAAPVPPANIPTP